MYVFFSLLMIYFGKHLGRCPLLRNGGRQSLKFCITLFSALGQPPIKNPSIRCKHQKMWMKTKFPLLVILLYPLWHGKAGTGNIAKLFLLVLLQQGNFPQPDSTCVDSHNSPTRPRCTAPSPSWVAPAKTLQCTLIYPRASESFCNQNKRTKTS